MRIKSVLTITSKDLFEMLQIKYDYQDIEFIWLDLKETVGHWQQRYGIRDLNDEVKVPNLKTESFRIHPDGSFDRGIQKDK